MKKSTDPRHKKRTQVIKELFAWDFNHQDETIKQTTTRQIIDNLNIIDSKISQIAKDWPIDQINKIDLSILRLSIFELIIDRQHPYKVIIDEAVELGKEFGSDSSSGFINGALGNLVKLEGLEKHD